RNRKVSCDLGRVRLKIQRLRCPIHSLKYVGSAARCGARSLPTDSEIPIELPIDFVRTIENGHASIRGGGHVKGGEVHSGGPWYLQRLTSAVQIKNQQPFGREQSHHQVMVRGHGQAAHHKTGTCRRRCNKESAVRCCARACSIAGRPEMLEQFLSIAEKTNF